MTRLTARLSTRLLTGIDQRVGIGRQVLLRADLVIFRPPARLELHHPELAAGKELFELLRLGRLARPRPIAVKDRDRSGSSN